MKNSRSLILGLTAAACSSTPDPEDKNGRPAREVQEFTASDGIGGEFFGGSVALSGDGRTLIVGSAGQELGTGTESAAGAVYVFERSGAAWSETARIALPPGDTTRFGQSVVVSNDGTVFAAGVRESHLSSLEGSVIVFRKSGMVWTQEAYLWDASMTDIGGDFGYALALSGDGTTLAIGAPSGNRGPLEVSSTGSAYVYARTSTTWSREVRLLASNANDRDFFGESVALSADGSTLVVGASTEASAASGVGGDQSDNSLRNAGAVYAFDRNGGWTQSAYIKASNPRVDDHFGIGVALSADGSTLGVSGMYSQLYVLARSGSTWIETLNMAFASPGRGESGIVTLSADGATLVSGSFGEDSITTGIDSVPDLRSTAAGAAYIFTRSGETWSHATYIKPPETHVYDHFGRSVSLSADGSTLAIGVPKKNRDRGSVYVYTLPL